MTTVVAIVAVLLLVYFSVLVGMSLDSEAQRRARKRLAAERYERTAQAEVDRSGLCAGCPLRTLLDE